MIVFLIYAAVFVSAFALVRFIVGRTATGFAARKTVTFGDESAVVPDRAASVVSVLVIFLLWGAFTGSRLLPGFLHAPGPFIGDATFSYTAEADGVGPDEATVTVRVFEVGQTVATPTVDPGEGWAKNDSDTVGAWRSGLIRVAKNDEATEGHRVTMVNGQPIAPGLTVETTYGRIGMSPKGTLNFEPAKGWQMEPIWLPAPEAVVARLTDIAREGYRGASLWEHLGFSLFRVVVGFFFGALVGIPLGYAMGLSNWFRGWFDPIVEFMRPVPPLALIPLVIIWAGIGELGKIILLFLAALWIMAIAARAGVSGVAIPKVHAAYSLGASRWQIMRHVIVPNSLPEIFTGARVAMGVCWGTVVAAELVAAEKGVGMMIMVASKFQQTDIVIMGIVLIGLIGFGIDILMRWAEKLLVPWKGRI
ncbi:ABC transporter permease [Sagittula salina]|uniref:ABC transporter permease subunit n=1 Tax=Sagittula salina TaxID=2820268 RepID=A0A940MMJ1_9RHOB|nr:ABC transporter permease subunit [Sagittula salina]MBP0481492.1 ABC transporter permease subunit [Sagittula salina]